LDDVEELWMLAEGVGLFTSTILKFRALSSTFYRQSEKKTWLSESVINLGGCYEIKYSQPVVAYIPARSTVLGRGFPFASTDRLSLVCRACRAQHRTAELFSLRHRERRCWEHNGEKYSLVIRLIPKALEIVEVLRSAGHR
jgi:hypothetical protein